jgi:hypothetical protein
MDVQQHQVPFLLAQQIQRLVTAGSLADGVDARISFQKLFEPSPNNRVIVGDQYS